jgi:protoporphyrin/coproporphyrin ferrochelatase
MKTAVLAMAYGSPSRSEDIPAYFADIRGGRPVRAEAVHELVERYRRIGGSPLNEITEAQRAALERELDLPVYVGMKHWRPWIADAVAQALADGAERIVGLVLAPHYSRMSIGGYRERVERALDGNAELRFLESWHDHEPFIRVVADRVRGTLASRSWDVAGNGGKEAETHVVFTAHSLPERILAGGDPYRDQLLETSRLVAARAGVPPERWSFAFQSASETGEPWLGPDVVDEVDRLHGEGVRKILVCPVGFVADHLEILWDIDVEARDRARELGIELDRIPSLNDDPAFVGALADLVREAIDA